jgi:hypothetical protein
MIKAIKDFDKLKGKNNNSEENTFSLEYYIKEKNINLTEYGL